MHQCVSSISLLIVKVELGFTTLYKVRYFSRVFSRSHKMKPVGHEMINGVEKKKKFC